MSIGSRLKDYLKERELTQDEFSTLCGVSKQTINNIIRNKTSPSGDVLERISAEYQDLNLNWLISGKGKMMNISRESASNPLMDFTKESLLELIKEKNSLNSSLKEMIDMQKETISYQREMIDNLSGK